MINNQTADDPMFKTQKQIYIDFIEAVFDLQVQTVAFFVQSKLVNLQDIDIYGGVGSTNSVPLISLLVSRKLVNKDDQEKCIEMIKLLLRMGTNPNAVDGCGMTALHVALVYGGEKIYYLVPFIKVIQLLIKYGGDVTKSIPGYISPLAQFERSTVNGRLDIPHIALLLIEPGVLPDRESALFRQAFFKATKLRSMCKELVHSADLLRLTEEWKTCQS